MPCLSVLGLPFAKSTISTSNEPDALTQIVSVRAHHARQGDDGLTCTFFLGSLPALDVAAYPQWLGEARVRWERHRGRKQRDIPKHVRDDFVLWRREFELSAVREERTYAGHALGRLLEAKKRGTGSNSRWLGGMWIDGRRITRI